MFIFGLFYKVIISKERLIISILVLSLCNCTLSGSNEVFRKVFKYDSKKSAGVLLFKQLLPFCISRSILKIKTGKYKMELRFNKT